MKLEDKYAMHRELLKDVQERANRLGALNPKEAVRLVLDIGTRLREAQTVEDHESVKELLLDLAGRSLALLAKERDTHLHEEYVKLNLLYRVKNTDYGDSFGKSLKALGLIAGVVRLYDKAMRIETLYSKTVERKVKDETKEDTIADLTNYSLMTVIEIKAYNGTLLEQEER